MLHLLARGSMEQASPQHKPEGRSADRPGGERAGTASAVGEFAGQAWITSAAASGLSRMTAAQRVRVLTTLQGTQGNEYVARLVQQVSSHTPTAIQRFDPPGHEQATIGGLRYDYSAEEIGAIYTANWERDFSQGPARIANAAIAWKAVKRSAARHRGVPSPQTSQRFRTAIDAVVRMSVLHAQDESMGGYRYWEHVDNPGGSAATNANRRWYGTNNAPAGALPGTIMDSRAYIKDEIVAAVDAYRAQRPGTHPL